MLLSRNWLDEYIDISHLSDNEIAEGLTRSGIEVESVNKLVNSSGIVVAQITSIRKHPNADKLNICTITIGNNVEFEVVCGAQNVSEYIKVAYARVGSIVNGTQIDSTEIRGVISPGMLCSFSELGIDDKYIEENQSEGIAILSNSYELGLDVIDVLDFNDTVFELSLTPNRSDCLSIIGVSYELSAIFDLPFKQKTVVYPKVDNNKTLLNLNVTNQNVNYFSLLPLHKIKITESPQFIKSRLIASGIRPINNIIDITNYVMIETGQPLHAFDLHKTGTEFEVRSAFKNETLETLDGKKIVLTNDDIVVSNNDEALSLAGVMGGYNSRITKYTENIVLECAVFNREVIRQSSKVHLTRTDSSMRFEKGIDINKVELAMKMALNLLIEYANAKVSVNVVDYKSDDFIYDTSAIAVTLDKINKYIGHDVEVDTIVDILKRLHFNFKYENRVFYINKISRRQDITQDVCIIEEVMRLYGLDKIVGELPKLPLRKSVIEEYDPRTISIKNTLLGMGYTETISYSLTNLEKASIKLLDNQKLVELINPLSSERQYFRQSVVSFNC